MATENLSKQHKLVRSRFKISNHTFINKLADGIREHVAQSAPVDLKYVGKSESGDAIEAKLVSVTTVSGAEAYDELHTAVRSAIDELRNPSKLLSLIK